MSDAYHRPVRDSERCECQCGAYGCASRRKTGVAQHGASGYSAGCACEECMEAHLAKTLKQRKRINDASQAGAIRRRQQWTSADLEVAVRSDLTAREAAAMLGRSVSAVKNVRVRCNSEPKYINLLGAGSGAH